MIQDTKKHHLMTNLEGNRMAFKLPDLPYAMDALKPFLTPETLEFHYGKHHQAYVTNLNKLVEGTPKAEATLETLIKTTDGAIFNNAAQVWNHTFYWNCLGPNAGGEPTGALADMITKTWGSFAAFKEKFSAAAVGQFGSGWAWLVKNADGTLAIEQTSNAGNPMTKGQKPLLTCDVWEHAYYIDYRNARPKYVENFWSMVNWKFVASQL